MASLVVAALDDNGPFPRGHEGRLQDFLFKASFSVDQSFKVKPEVASLLRHRSLDVSQGQVAVRDLDAVRCALSLLRKSEDHDSDGTRVASSWHLHAVITSTDHGCRRRHSSARLLLLLLLTTL